MRDRLQRLEKCLVFIQIWSNGTTVSLRQDDVDMISISVVHSLFMVRGLPYEPLQRYSCKEAVLQSTLLLSQLDDRETVLQLRGSAGHEVSKKTFMGTRYAVLPFEPSLTQTTDSLHARITLITQSILANLSTFHQWQLLSLRSDTGARIDMLKPRFMQRGLQFVSVDGSGSNSVDWLTAIQLLENDNPSVVTLCVRTSFNSYDISFNAPAFNCHPSFSLLFS